MVDEVHVEACEGAELDAIGVVWEQLLWLEGREVQRQSSDHNQHRFIVARWNAYCGSKLILPTHPAFSLQNNALFGTLPSLANLSMFESVFLSSNNFTSIPDGCFQGLTSLQTLSMTDSINLAPWMIPANLTDSNNLTGGLPKSFVGFAIWNMWLNN